VKRALILPLTLASALVHAETPLTRTAYEQVATALVRVHAVGCPDGKARYSQGFVVDRNGSILTVRHGVAGCTTFQIETFSGTDHADSAHTIEADLSRVLKQADLALLRVRRSAELLPSPLALDTGGAAPNTILYAVARWLDSPGVREKELRVAFGSKQLGQIVPTSVRDDLLREGAPAIDLPILHLDLGIIVHGTSGAPIINSAGRVIAIADGGLENGVAGVNWAIPIGDHYKALLASAEPKPTAAEGRIAAEHFASELQSKARATVDCGGVKMTHLLTRTFADLSDSTDDPQGLTVLAGEFFLDTKSARFDVYQDLDSGATVALPAGAVLRQYQGGCTASLGNGHVYALLRVEPSAPTEVKEKETAFGSWLANGELGWERNSRLSYLRPIKRDDGLEVSRVYGSRPVKTKFGVGVTDFLFYTIAFRGTTLLDVAGKVHFAAPVYEQSIRMCLANPKVDPGCSGLLSDLDNWGRMAAAVHITTFTRQSGR
jgi:hypothetical protein